MPAISIVIPAYNAERTILETVASVQNQTFYDFEIIVIDDGSKDRTLELLHSVVDDRVNIFSYENGGTSVARNRGLSHATGNFIAFLDADDLWTPDKLELQLAALQKHPEAGVAYSWSRFMDEQGNPSYIVDEKFIEGNVYDQLLLNNFLHNGSSPLIRKQAIDSVGEFDPNPACAGCEDWDFYLRLALKWNFVLVPKPQVLYRQSSSSTTSKIEKMEAAALFTLEKAYRVAPSNLQHLKPQSLARIYQYCTRQYLERRTSGFQEINKGGQKLWMSIRLHPPILLEKYTYDLLKWFIKRWALIGLSPQKS